METTAKQERDKPISIALISESIYRTHTFPVIDQIMAKTKIAQGNETKNIVYCNLF